jgi:tRNA C32,U32 (ribose-2'-O)-methylase TrmJ
MDEVVASPQAPQVESLNVGVAASIVLYEVARQGMNHEGHKNTRSKTHSSPKAN